MGPSEPKGSRLPTLKHTQSSTESEIEGVADGANGPRGGMMGAGARVAPPTTRPNQRSLGKAPPTLETTLGRCDQCC